MTDKQGGGATPAQLEWTQRLMALSGSAPPQTSVQAPMSGGPPASGAAAAPAPTPLPGQQQPMGPGSAAAPPAAGPPATPTPPATPAAAGVPLPPAAMPSAGQGTQALPPAQAAGSPEVQLGNTPIWATLDNSPLVGADPPTVGVNLRQALGRVTISGGASVSTTGDVHATAGLTAPLGPLELGVAGQAGADQQVTVTAAIKF